MTKKDTTDIQRAIKKLHGISEQERIFHRLHSVILALHTASASEAARIYNDSPRAVAYWVTRFKKMGIEGLQSKPRPGRRSTLDEDQMEILRKFIQQRQRKSVPVNSKLLSQFIKNTFDVELTERHCFRILKRLDA